MTLQLWSIKNKISLENHINLFNEIYQNCKTFYPLSLNKKIANNFSNLHNFWKKILSHLLGDEGGLIKAALIKSLNPPLPAASLPPTVPFPGVIARGGCPLCDRSVYSYCSYKMIHDACCCNGGNFSNSKKEKNCVV